MHACVHACIRPQHLEYSMTAVVLSSIGQVGFAVQVDKLMEGCRGVGLQGTVQVPSGRGQAPGRCRLLSAAGVARSRTGLYCPRRTWALVSSWW